MEQVCDELGSYLLRAKKKKKTQSATLLKSRQLKEFLMLKSLTKNDG